MNVFTYGSLMYPEVWDRVVRGEYQSAGASLSGYRRLAVLGASYPGVIRCDGALTRGRVYFDVAADDIARLDAFEAAEYRRDEVVVAIDGETAPARAQVYVFVVESLLADRDWDVSGFERDRLATFAAEHNAPGARSG